MKKKVKWTLAVLILILCAAGGLTAALQPVIVETERTAESDLTRRVTVQAKMAPRYSTVLSSVTAGTVLEIPHQAGETVKAGELVARTDSASQVSLDLQQEQLKAQLSSSIEEYERLYGENGAAQSELKVAKGRYDLAESSYEKGLVLAQDAFLAQAELDVLRTERDQAYQAFLQAKENNSESRRAFFRSQIESLERQLSMLEDSGGPGTVYMPYDGVLWELYAEQGTYLSPNQPVGKVYRTDDMRLQASVLSEDGAALTPGMEAEVVYADGTESPAEVIFLSPIAADKISAVGLEENRRTVELAAERLPENAGAGQTADVTFSVILSSGVLTVPSSAVVPEGDGSVVYVARDGRARKLQVETGRREGGRVEIRTGLSAEENVIVDPYETKISEGKRVKILTR